MSRMESHPVAVSAFSLLTLLAFMAIGLLAWDITRKGSAVPPLQLPDQVNPNDADLSMLVCLPGLGPVRARAIITYRIEHCGQDPCQPVFSQPDDLIAVKGIGPGTVKAMIPYLCFD